MTFNDQHEKRALRHEKKLLRLGSPDPLCQICKRPCDFRSLSRDQNGTFKCRNCRNVRKSYSSIVVKRRQQAFQKAGYLAPRCLICGERRLETLELHHVAGEANSALLAPLCSNCHTVQSDEQEDLPVDLRFRDPDRRPLVLQAAFDCGLAILAGAAALTSEDQTESVFLGMIAVALLAWAVYNIAADQHFAATYGQQYSAGVTAPVPK